MNKNILIISASPRKDGNSDLLCDEFAKGARSAGHRVEKVRLADKTIHYCRGCGACNDTHVCLQKDDMADLLDKVLEADVIVLATPVYFYTLCAQMKTFIDRTVPRYLDMRNKEFYFILAAAEDDRSRHGTHRGMFPRISGLPGRGGGKRRDLRHRSLEGGRNQTTPRHEAGQNHGDKGLGMFP